MKNILIIASDEGASGYDNIDRSYTEHVARMIASDINAVAKAVIEKGFIPYVYHLKNNENTASYKFYGNFLIDGIKVIRKDDVKDFLSIFCAVFFIGLPAMAGTAGAFLDNTILDYDIFDYKINGKSSGVIGICKEFFMSNGIPVLMSSGCKLACEESINNGISEVVVSKTARYCARNFADLVEVSTVHNKLYETTLRVLNNIDSISCPQKINKKVEILIEFIREDYLEEFIIQHDNFERISARTAKTTFTINDEIGRFIL